MDKRESFKIAIVGLGVVGNSLECYLRQTHNLTRNQHLFLYDADPEKEFFDDINQADIIFVSLPTPSLPNGSCDLSAVKSTIDKVGKNKIVVLKSTIPPGTTEWLQRSRPDLKLLYNPEFLTEKQAWEDFIKPDRQIVGFTEKSLEVAHLVLSLLPKAPFMSPWGINTYQHISITATEAEIIKYGGNIWFARKLNFANILNQLCEKVGKKLEMEVDYENVRKGLASDFRIGDSHLNVNHEGYQGWGGSCLPKDLRALIDSLKKLGLDQGALLLEQDLDFNKYLLQLQGLTLEEVSKRNHKKLKSL
ncbi:MAG: hypothetical protein A2W61_01315 [Deltaproteobacteria bacterium RIFCSPLOWO2_01_44_7]|nr:MAG: hypothetical protein A2712_02375 [Deltaproteobacteria bacterium RIFCSPHIGHO2_01_FULL_43_49]OGQ15031.1 MAG: hypothetical protein A3D22_03105 [Deltaproteobacteria bacterium RIFCSPHIGHO2_02_FULL_44_53]OGQ27350.1 MAG: hypothetical protein A3D98_02970 [Deltaproteobacteria bacterium RIFCSPHIGHO2_12_FULL_44_21]OGQ31548.1 MAG: hypothetical protein A2979_04265 [Deltaproteobacteria bacterium RIFCSPLOWO2_01_FULL_45_74]OGQ39017.1 MAG: hypothetical protein A2W61_01315 [Deltaproteobacteria bacterium 